MRGRSRLRTMRRSSRTLVDSSTSTLPLDRVDDSTTRHLKGRAPACAIRGDVGRKPPPTFQQKLPVHPSFSTSVAKG